MAIFSVVIKFNINEFGFPILIPSLDSVNNIIIGIKRILYGNNYPSKKLSPDFHKNMPIWFNFQI